MNWDKFDDKPGPGKIKIFLWSLVCFMGLVLLFQVILVSDKDRILKVIVTGQKALEEKSISKCERLIASTYYDNLGMDKSTLLEVVEQCFTDMEAPKVGIHKIKFMEMDSSNARTKIEFNLTGIINTDKILLLYSFDEIEMYFIKEHGDWLVQRIDFVEFKEDKTKYNKIV